VRIDIDDKSIVGEGNYTVSTSTGPLNANTTASIAIRRLPITVETSVLDFSIVYILQCRCLQSKRDCSN
jgi:hypothetical protein